MRMHTDVHEVLVTDIKAEQVYSKTDRGFYFVCHGFWSFWVSRWEMTRWVHSAFPFCLTKSSTKNRTPRAYPSCGPRTLRAFQQGVGQLGTNASTGKWGFEPHTQPSQPLWGCIIEYGELNRSPSSVVSGTWIDLRLPFGGELPAFNLPFASERQGRSRRACDYRVSVCRVRQNYF